MRNALFALPALALAAAIGVMDARSFDGRYDVIGADPDGAPYRGRARIVADGPDGCRIAWSGGAGADGVCLRAGRSFTAAYRSQGKAGLAVYQIMGDGSMQGLWTLDDIGGVGRETLVPVR
jgi:hypothetical protein